MSRTAAILLAAGSGSRMNGVVTDKILAPLAGRPVFSYSVSAFMQSAIADLYVIVYRDQRQMLELSAYAPTPSVLVRGGNERQESVMHALAALPADIAHVFIHDCARPLIQPEQLVALHKIVRREHAVVLAHRVTDTIKEHLVRTAGGQEHVRLRTIDRARLWGMETPQVFSRELISRAYARVQARGLHITDDAQAVETLGEPVALLENPHPNPKLTTAADFKYLEFLLAQESPPPAA
ncbi:2-C-methyl-D-erythritol 4-phosphate cytidylyltransferase [Opitutus sp. ER46]|uniref:2-C-methyl-D-erythritol 4-phosphate cytidylyltransferase n=1 Tax=Opitutus sp. ER46 TaxID=2161864 RepID=UPI000D303AAC|nr:2-C-methyl-D-erythritol 4-phosphate cytidylyltransferase [Opitutus sp. ER46]PTX92551.1 2-C-methyl-D-erythritol 4-phosphate cytidylyltransferase [Opitutus sp. ER46]